MTRHTQPTTMLSRIHSCTGIAVAGLALMLVLAASQLQAQTFTVLHAFGGPGDGGVPFSGVTLDAKGDIYGASVAAVYKLAHTDSGWSYARLWSHGLFMQAVPLIAADGSIYVSDTEGGITNGGRILHLTPPASYRGLLNNPWDAKIIHVFTGLDGNFPTTISFDASGNIIGTTVEGGGMGAGVVYKLINNKESWIYAQITDFSGTTVAGPGSGVVVDASGNFYGTTLTWPGQVFEVTSSGTASLIYEFSCCQVGIDTYGSVILDGHGNLYGTTTFEGPGGGGTAYELTSTGATWILSLLQGFPGIVGNGTIGTAAPVMDTAGNIYGTSTWGGANGYGLVFKLTPSANGWIYTDLHDFTCGDDGCYPWDGLAVDSQGNVYGTASQGGQYDHGYQPGGTLWEITP
jgi:hypothetical protein